jgi:hypothetical protein
MKEFSDCLCVRPGPLSGGAPDSSERVDYVSLDDLRRECVGLGVVVRARDERELQ